MMILSRIPRSSASKRHDHQTRFYHLIPYNSRPHRPLHLPPSPKRTSSSMLLLHSHLQNKNPRPRALSRATNSRTRRQPGNFRFPRGKPSSLRTARPSQTAPIPTRIIKLSRTPSPVFYFLLDALPLPEPFGTKTKKKTAPLPPQKMPANASFLCSLPLSPSWISQTLIEECLSGSCSASAVSRDWITRGHSFRNGGTRAPSDVAQNFASGPIFSLPCSLPPSRTLVTCGS